jgi:hypothetical protein
MPIVSIISEPASSQLTAAYRPIVLRVRATKTDGTPRPPVVYCDIYFGSVFYKTLSKTQYTTLNTLDSDWEFDIQDAAQEFLKKALVTFGLSQIAKLDDLITRCFVKFRSSGINTDGFIQTEDTAPVQGTDSTVPVSGTGTQSNEFFILNATLQHEDNQDITSHLSTFKRKTWAPNTFPLSHRTDNYLVTPVDSDFFPIVYLGSDRPAFLRLHYRFRNQNTWRVAETFTTDIVTSPQSVYYIPNGPANLHPLFSPSFNDIHEYYLEILDTTSAVIATTNVSRVDACEDDYVRIHFLNRLGAIDAINFKIQERVQETKSDTTERPTTSPLVKSVHAVRRFSVKSNDTYTCLNSDLLEPDMDFVDELFASPLHWIGWLGIEGQPADYIPIVLSDQKNTKRKLEDRFSYEISIEFKLSHEKFIIRN